jgi:hypothetical protein
LESIEEKIKKELESKNANKKTYIWIFSILTLSTLIGIYSYQTNTGVLSKHTLNKEVKIKNQENLELLFNENQLKFQAKKEEEVQKDAIASTKTHQEANVRLPAPNEEQIVQTQSLDDTKPLALLEKPFAQTQEKKGDATKLEQKKEDTNKEIIKQTKSQTQKPLVATIKLHESLFTTLSCLSYTQGVSLPSDECKKEVEAFLKKNTQISRIEIVPILNVDDIKASNSSEKALAKKRMEDMSSFIKTLNDALDVPSHSNYLKVSLDHTGVVIRLYN